MNFQKTHIKSSKFTLQNVINTMVWFGSCDAFTPRLSWVLTAALFREWSEWAPPEKLQKMREMRINWWYGGDGHWRSSFLNKPTTGSSEINL